jgi:S1-C subfamily serine protease
MRRALTVVCLALLAAGCAGQVEAPVGEAPTVRSSPTESETPQASRVDDVRLPRLSQDGFRRRASTLTLRVRNVGCAGLGTGSGFAIDNETLVTNRHVLAGADRLEVNAWDGRTLSVVSANVGVLGDIGYVQVSERLPAVGARGDELTIGQRITAVGYPLGGPLTLSSGKVVDLVDGTPFGVQGEVARLTATVQPGNSGGPVLDDRGRVVGVVFAFEIARGLALAIPLQTADALVAAGGLDTVPPCGAE